MKHPTKEIFKKVGVAGCKHTTRDLIAGLARAGLRIDHVITIAPEKAADQQVAGYMDLRPYLEGENIPCTVAETYNLKSERDERALRALGLDILLVMGWQRLIPDWYLSALSIGAYGMHGSSRPLPHGRGRSPMNWSLIQGKDIFYTHLFQYLPGVDDGPIAAVQTFDITPHDDCHTLHLKNTIAMTQLCAAHLPALMDGTAVLTPQPAGPATYYPKRGPEDGLIHWTEPAAAIHNLIRAVTRPFPGAFSYLDDDPAQKITIWRAIPFDTRLTWPGAVPGQILEVFYDGTLLIQSGDIPLHIQDTQGCRFTPEHIGRRLGPAGTPKKIWKDLPE